MMSGHLSHSHVWMFKMPTGEDGTWRLLVEEWAELTSVVHKGTWEV